MTQNKAYTGTDYLGEQEQKGNRAVEQVALGKLKSQGPWLFSNSF